MQPPVPTARRLPPAARFVLALALIGATACHRHRDSTVTIETVTVASTNNELEPNDESASPHYVGVLYPYQAIELRGHVREGDPAVDPLADEFDGFAISLTEPSRIEFTLTFPDTTAELDAWIYDPAIDDIAIYFESDFSPETGAFFVDAPVLDFHVVVRALFGEANYSLIVFAQPIFAATAGEPESASGIRLLDEASERASAVAGRSRSLARLRYLDRSDEALPFLPTDALHGQLIQLDASGAVEEAPILVLPAPTVR